MTAPAGPSRPVAPWPGVGSALLLALLAAIARLFAAELLGRALGFRDSVIGMSAILGYGVVLALSAPRLGVPAPLAFGVAPARSLTWLALPLFLPWLLLVSELDNYVGLWLPHPGGAGKAAALTEPLALLEIVLATAIAVPACEELLFRGLLQTALAPRLGRWTAALFVALLDGLALFPLFGPRAALSAAAQALSLGFVREAAGSLWPALGLHVGFGAIAVAARLGAFGIAGFDDTSVAHTPAGWIVAAAVSCALAFAICVRALRPSGSG